MVREEFKNIVKAIRAAYTSCPITSQEVFDMWYEMLNDCEYADVSMALKKHMKSNKFPPTIAELRGSTEKKNKFNNFLPRGYDMEKLESALLEAQTRKSRSELDVSM